VAGKFDAPTVFVLFLSSASGLQRDPVPLVSTARNCRRHRAGTCAACPTAPSSCPVGPTSEVASAALAWELFATAENDAGAAVEGDDVVAAADRGPGVAAVAGAVAGVDIAVAVVAAVAAAVAVAVLLLLPPLLLFLCVFSLAAVLPTGAVKLHRL